MDRNEKVLLHVDKNGHGIEIGPSHNPIAPKKDGYSVQIIDHASREQLIEKYKNHNLNLDNIEEVDFVWQGQPYTELTGKSKHYDWIIASHLIEHTPDLIGFLKECDTILKDDGIISLVVPDKRYCFDHYRPVTGISRIIDNHLLKKEIHSAGTVAEYFLNVVSKGGNIAWHPGATGEFSFVHSLDQAVQGMDAVINHNKYLDVHAWCFVPHSFRLMVHDLFCFGLIPFQEVEFFPTATEGCEFYVTLSRKGKGISQSRLELLDIIKSEMSE